MRPLTMAARLKPDVTIERAQAAVDVLTQRLSEAYPVTDGHVSMRVMPEPDGRPVPLPFMARILPAVKLLASLGFKTIATSGTQRYLAEQGVETAKINKVLEGRPHIVDAIKNGGVQLVFNTTEGAAALADSRSLRNAALLHKVPYYTTLSGAVAAAQGIKAYLAGDLEVRALQSYFDGKG
jgi:hypothetical protein